MRKLAILIVTAVAALAGTAAPADAHFHLCHQVKSCPSDDATYRWRGLRCAVRSSDAFNASFKRRVRYSGRTYFCKR